MNAFLPCFAALFDSCGSLDFSAGWLLAQSSAAATAPAASSAGEGTVWHVTFARPWTAGAVVVFLLVAAAWAVGWYRREGAVGRGWKLLLAGLRVSAALLLLAMICELQLAAERVVLPNLPILLDVSASMAEVDRWDSEDSALRVRKLVEGAKLDPPHRLHQAEAVLLQNDARLLSRLAERYSTALFTMGAGLERLEAGTASGSGRAAAAAKALGPLQPTAQQSRLGQGVLDVLSEYRGREPAAVVLFTDGVVTQGPSLSDAAEQARRRGAPLYIVAMGRETIPQDVEVVEALAEDVVFVDDVLVVNVTVRASGFAGERARLTLKRKNSDAVLAEQHFDLPADGAVKTVQIPYRPTEEGEFDFVAEVEPAPKETHRDDNSAEVHVVVRKGKFKVLLVDAFPRFEFRYLKSLLQRDPTIDLKVLLQSSDRQWSTIERDGMVLTVFPISPTELNAFDVVIFGDVNPDFIPASAQAQLVKAVKEQGRGLIVVAGSMHLPISYRTSPLWELFPLDCRDAEAPNWRTPISQGTKWVLSDLGRQSPITLLGESAGQSETLWQNLPEYFWHLRGVRLKPGAFALAEHPTETTPDGAPLPLVAIHQIGRGRVLFHATDDTWRWRDRVGDLYFARYWLQAIRFLASARLRGGGVELTTDRSRYELGEPIQIEARVDGVSPQEGGDKLEVVVERNDERTRVPLARNPLSPDKWTGVFRPTRDGKYHAWIRLPQGAGDQASVDFAVDKPQLETQRLQTDLAGLRRAAQLSGGKLYTLADVDRLADDLPRGRTTTIEAQSPHPLWNQWYSLVLFVGVLTAEWALRKRLGLV